jgi:long-subunit fatty acid transport protein
MKDYLGLSSGGRGAYENILYDLAWKHTFSKSWSSGAGFNYQEGDNLDFVTPANYRNDSIYTISGGVAYALNVKTKLDASISREWSDSAVANKPGREYVHWLVSAGVKYTF